MLKIGLEVDWRHRRVTIIDPARARVRFSLALVAGFKVEGEDMLVTLTDVQKVAATIAVLDAKGNPAAIDGVPVWAAGDPAILAVTPAADGLSAVIAAVGPLTAGTQVTVTADADVGEGVKPIVGILDVAVVASEAVSVNVTAGTPEPQ